jgi:signal transduction histidine kinase
MCKTITLAKAPCRWYTEGMKWFRKLFTPLSALIGIQLVWVLIVVFWIYWFIGRHKELRRLTEQYKPDLLAGYHFDWLVLAEGLALLVVILIGVYVIFLYWQRQSSLNRQQRNFISQVTHELKSPLASIRLHLETIRLRKPSPDRLERFLDTMLDDTSRLENHINKLLMAARLEHGFGGGERQNMDFSEFVTQFLERKLLKLPEGGSLTWRIEPGIRVELDPEGMAMALRNLFENAILYSLASPEIEVTLARESKRCLLIFSDQGRGMAKGDVRKVFRMFYRVRTTGENIRGTGLGLYIVQSIIERHGGRIRATSPGVGKGTAFQISLPLAKTRGE